MKLTRDVVSDGALVIFQSESGYRFGLDAVLLATDLPELPEGARVADLGAGSGAVGLMIASRRPDATVDSVELQSSLYELLERNIQYNGLEGRVNPISGDVRQHTLLLKPHSADLVVCNPPYYRVGQGKASPVRERAVAHQEMNGTLRDFLKAAQYVAKPRGLLKLVIPPLRLSDLMLDIARTDFFPVSVRFIHARPGRDAYLMEWVFRRGSAPQFRVLEPLVLHGEDGFREEVRARFSTAARPGDGQ